MRLKSCLQNTKAKFLPLSNSVAYFHALTFQEIVQEYNQRKLNLATPNFPYDLLANAKKAQKQSTNHLSSSQFCFSDLLDWLQDYTSK